MKILRKAFYIDDNYIAQCKLVLNDRGLEVLLGGWTLRLDNDVLSLSLKEVEVIKDLKGRSFLIDASDVLEITYRMLTTNKETFLKLFGNYIGKNPNLYEVSLRGRSKTHRFILAQRDMVKLRNHLSDPPPNPEGSGSRQ